MPPLSIMVKPASSLCNLSCKYCFYKDVAKHREDAGFGKMSTKTAEKLVREVLLFADSSPISFTFQGGEPTLAGIDFFKFFTKCVKQNNKKHSPVFFSIQTNGTILNEDWAYFFNKNNFLVGLSLDGSKADNKFRLYPNGEDTYNNVISAAEMLKNHNVDFNILTVLTGYCAQNGEMIYNFYKTKGFKYLQFIPCLRPFGSNEKSELYMTAEQYSDFLIKVFKLYADDFLQNNYISIREFDNMIHLFIGQNVEQCGISGRCSRQFVAEANGNIYPCDFYCTDEYLLGNINNDSFEKIANCETAKKFILESLPVPERCKKCRLYPVCRAGGCKRTKLSEDYCEAYKKFWTECLPLVSEVARHELNNSHPKS